MVGPKDIQNRPLPGQFQRPTTTQTPSTGKKSPAGQAHDAARVAQGAGFVRQGVQKKRAGDASDPLSGQLVLPESELDLDAQSMAALKSCLERTEGMAAQLGGLQGSNSSDGPQSLCESLVGFTPDNQIRLEALSQREGEPAPEGMEEALRSALRALGEAPGSGASIAELLVQLSAKVAGLPPDASGDVITAARTLCKKANQSVGQAQKMINGIDQQLSVHRTFVFRR